MADREGNNPRKARQDDRNDSQNSTSGHRHHEENASDVRMSRDHSQPITTRTQLMSVPDTSVDSHVPMNVDIAQTTRNGQAQIGQTVQSHGNRVSEADQQLATRSCVHNLNKGPTQFGETNIVNNYITNNNNHYHYHCPHQPPHYHGNIPEHHDPNHCALCLDFHNNDHQPVANQHHPQPETQPQQQQLPHQSVPRLLSSQQQTEQTELSTQRDEMLRPQNQTVGQRVKASGQSVPATDVTDNVILAEARVKKSAKPAVATKEVPKSQTSRGVSRSSETRQVSDDEVTDNVTIIDSNGRRLIPGDAVLCSVGCAIYTGNQCIVWCKERGQVVKSGTLDMTQTFKKRRITSGKCRVFPPVETVQRAVSRVRTGFTEVDGLYRLYGLDFTCWVTTGLGAIQAYSRGFRLGRY